MGTPARVRIAPSPTGDPHVGTAYTGLFNWLLARKTGGQFILRIEDTDRQRSTKESEDAILRSLGWLGLDWDEGPDVGGPHGSYRQSERSDLYRDQVQVLLEKGAAYPCFCTAERLAEMRDQQRKNKSAFGYDGLCRTLEPAEIQRRQDAGEPYVVRLKVDRGASTTFHDHVRGDITIENSNVDDQVLLKSDGFPTYHLANVVDDHDMGVTHVLRAEEWIASTPKHVLLYEAFGWPMPVFCHLPLLRNADKTKISKRKNPTSLDYYRQEGFLPEAMLNFLALLGFSPGEGEGDEVFNREELQAAFDLDRISQSGPVFDLTKLEWLNGHWIRRLEDADLMQRLRDFHPGRDLPDQTLGPILPLIRERLKTLKDFDQWTDYFFVRQVPLSQEAFRRAKLGAPEMSRVLNAAADLLESRGDIDPEPDEAALRDLTGTLGVKVGSFFMTLRVAITGRSATPPLMEVMKILGVETSVRRLREAARFWDSEQTAGDL